MITNRVFAYFPTNAELYCSDIAPVVSDIISRHGLDEWRAAVLTNELHGHLGIYATIGVKMGIYAQELLNYPHHIKVFSHAGSTPPISCMNDGLQASTGATVGHGLINISSKHNPRPEAIFTSEDIRLGLRLKHDYAIQIERDVCHGSETFGISSPEYWSYIRSLAIKYWQQLDRNKIFETIMG